MLDTVWHRGHVLAPHIECALGAGMVLRVLLRTFVVLIAVGLAPIFAEIVGPSSVVHCTPDALAPYTLLRYFVI